MRQRFLKSGWQSLVAILIFVLLWEISVRIFAVEEWLLPAPSVIVLELFTVWPTFYPHLISTLILTMLGFTIGASVGLIVAMILHLRSEERRVGKEYMCGWSEYHEKKKRKTMRK